MSTQSNDFDDERDDEADYSAYQTSPHYAGYDGHGAGREEHLAGLLMQQSGEDADGSREDRLSYHSSTCAVADFGGEFGKAMNVSVDNKENEAENENWNVTNSDAQNDNCKTCGAEGQANSFTCSGCGEYGGGV